ncbi:protein of unknown function (plasmid) [Thermococcus nautili]|uniref:CRISPR-associated protein Cas4 n=1 Tax=Thermococcus nautili TaxID=195522 RepID=UPI002554717F|nr:PD-(D/E)XK nuclease family protein [Thermococcus nautili]CAI1494160.1 protein of unknown function [Thermococcus nautili]
MEMEVNKERLLEFSKRLEVALENGDFEEVGEAFAELLFTYDERDFEDKEIHVSSLDYCELKTALQIAYRIKTEQNTKMIKGKLLHFALESILEKGRELGIFKNDVSFEDESAVSYDLGNGWKIVGRPDFVIGDVVVDFKFSRLWDGATYDHYAMQVNTYAYLLGKKMAMLVVIDERDFQRVKVFPFVVSEEKFRETVEKAKRIAKAVEDLRAGKTPTGLKTENMPVFDWECRYCPVKAICDSMRDKIAEKG